MDAIETLYAGVLGSVELLRCSGGRAVKGNDACATPFHIVIPFWGSFVWHVGAGEIFADATRVLFAGGGEHYAISHPAGGECSLVITPSGVVLEELIGSASIDLHHSLLKGRYPHDPDRDRASDRRFARLPHPSVHGYRRTAAASVRIAT
jgi:hypothetical protein